MDLFPDSFGPMYDVLTFTKYVGGSPTNTAVQMAKMGLDVGFIGKVSQDPVGVYVRHFVESFGIDVSHMIFDSDPNTRQSLAIAEQLEKGGVTTVFYRNDIADLHLAMEDVDEAYIAQFKALLVSGTSLCRSPAREAVFTAIEYAKRNNVRVIFDFDHRDMAWKSLDEASLYYWLVAQKADVIFSTREESDVMERIVLPNNRDDAKSARLLLGHDPKLVCIKRGSDGSMVFTKDGNCYKGGIYPARLYKVLGAGDSFAGSFISRVSRGRPVEEAIRYGAASAALTISGRDCSASMPTLSVAEDYMAAVERGEVDSWKGWDALRKER
jgi:5-dehydro-2-deoxygluconokinase